MQSQVFLDQSKFNFWIQSHIECQNLRQRKDYKIKLLISSSKREVNLFQLQYSKGSRALLSCLGLCALTKSLINTSTSFDNFIMGFNWFDQSNSNTGTLGGGVDIVRVDYLPRATLPLPLLPLNRLQLDSCQITIVFSISFIC